MSDALQRIGVLTGGGDCPGMNAVIRAVVKTAINEYGWEVLGIEDGFEGLIQPHKARLLDVADVRGLLPRGGTILGSTNRANPFHYEVATNGAVKVFDVSETVVHRTREYGIDVLIVIGGDGSLRIASELMPKGSKWLACLKPLIMTSAGPRSLSALIRPSPRRWKRSTSSTPRPKVTTG